MQKNRIKPEECIDDILQKLKVSHIEMEDGAYHNKEILPFHKLMSAVLVRALLDCAESNNTRYSAAEWLYSDDQDPWSSNWIFDHLDLDKNRLLNALSGIKNYKEILRTLEYER